MRFQTILVQQPARLVARCNHKGMKASHPSPLFSVVIHELINETDRLLDG